MSRGLGPLLVMAASLTLASPALAASKDFDEAGFAAALDKAKASDPATDFAWLRQQNLLRFDYAIPDWDQAESAFGAIDKEPEKALELARQQIDVNYLDLFAHVVAEQASTKLGRNPDAEREHKAVVAILTSIIGGKDGRSAAQAFQAVSVTEEYQTVALLGLDVKGQRTGASDGHTYDILDVTDPETKEASTLWFEINSFFGKEFGL